MTSWTLQGGVVLDGHKEAALRFPIADLPLPRQLFFPLQARDKSMCWPCVSIGDEVEQGQLIARPTTPMALPLFASATGRVSALDSTRIVVDTTESRSSSGDTATDKRPVNQSDSPESSYTGNLALLVDKLREGGICGLGGGGFSASVKLSNLIETGVRTLIINSAECEPIISCDQALLRENPVELARAIVSLRQLTGADECLIGMEDDKPTEATSLQQAIDTLGDDQTHLELVPTRYPSGAERLLIRLLTGKHYPANQWPSSEGIICFNLQTTLAIHRWLYTGKPLTSRIVTVAGEAIDTPRNLRVPFGTPARELVNHVAGKELITPHYIVGGPMSGRALKASAILINASTNCLIVNESDTARVRNRHRTEQPCIRCGNCAPVCPVNLLPQVLLQHCQADKVDGEVTRQLTRCLECGCCDYVCPSAIPLTNTFRTAKQELWDQHRKAALASLAERRHAHREERMVRKEQAKQARIAAQKERAQQQRAKQQQGHQPANRDNP